jgi:DNA polymerase V
MQYRDVQHGNKEIKFISGKGRGEGSLKSFSFTSLPSIDTLRGYLPPKSTRKPMLDSSCLMAFGSLTFGKKVDLPYFEYFVPAGYPTSISDDPFKRHLDLSAYLIRHPKSVYYFKAFGYSMANAGINHRDLLVVDTALKPKHRDVVIAVLNGEFKLKRFCLEHSEVTLLSANPDYPPITITKEMNFFVQGVVTTVIRTFNPLPYDNHFKDISYPHL